MAKNKIVESNIEESLKIKHKPFTIELKEVDIASIVTQVSLQEARVGSEDGLTTSVDLLGVILPLVVIPFEGAVDKYILVDGFRRLYSLVRLEVPKVQVLVLSYEDKRIAKEDALILGRILSHTRPLTNKGLWNTIQYIEDIGISDYIALDTLFNLPAGSILKLKDVMSGEFDEPRLEFFDKEIPINKAKSKLDKLRKEAQRGDGDELEQVSKKSDTEIREELGLDFDIGSETNTQDYLGVDVTIIKKVPNDLELDEEVLCVIKKPYTDVVLPTIDTNDNEHILVMVDTHITQDEYNQFKDDDKVINLSHTQGDEDDVFSDSEDDVFSDSEDDVFSDNDEDITKDIDAANEDAIDDFLFDDDDIEAVNDVLFDEDLLD